MDDVLFNITAVLLLGGFVAAEVFMRRKSRRGVVVRKLTSETDWANWFRSEFLVQTDEGKTVVARADGCVLCRGDLRPGRRVGLMRDVNGYFVTRTGDLAPVVEET
jgi:hypothetical protein